MLRKANIQNVSTEEGATQVNRFPGIQVKTSQEAEQCLVIQIATC